MLHWFSTDQFLCWATGGANCHLEALSTDPPCAATTRARSRASWQSCATVGHWECVHSSTASVSGSGARNGPLPLAFASCLVAKKRTIYHVMSMSHGMVLVGIRQCADALVQPWFTRYLKLYVVKLALR